MKTEDITQDVIDNGRFKVVGWEGIAFYIHGWPQKAVPLSSYYAETDDGDVIEEIDEWEYVDDPDSGLIEVVMVGDDKVHTVDVSEITLISDDEYCSGCGQIGCGWG